MWPSCSPYTPIKNTTRCERVVGSKLACWRRAVARGTAVALTFWPFLHHGFWVRIPHRASSLEARRNLVDARVVGRVRCPEPRAGKAAVLPRPRHCRPGRHLRMRPRLLWDALRPPGTARVGRGGRYTAPASLASPAGRGGLNSRFEVADNSRYTFSAPAHRARPTPRRLRGTPRGCNPAHRGRICHLERARPQRSGGICPGQAACTGWPPRRRPLHRACDAAVCLAGVAILCG